MKITEIEKGANVLIQITINKNKLEFASKVMARDDKFVFIDVIRNNGNVMGISGEGVAVDIMLIRPDKSPIVWKNVYTELVSIKEGTVYKIKAFTEGINMNRREAFRLFVGISGVAQVGANRKAVNVIVKDVSETGYSFVSSFDIQNISVGTPVRLVFADLGINFSLMGIMVRKVTLSEDKILYGCSLSIKNAGLAKYINNKQRQLLSLNKDNSAGKMMEVLKTSLTEASILDRMSGVDADIMKAKNGNNELMDSAHKREIDDVEKDERRDVFKGHHKGQKL